MAVYKAGDLSESTVNRFVNVISIQLKTTTNQDMRRYERLHINEVWCGDSSVEPYLTTPDGKNIRFLSLLRLMMPAALSLALMYIGYPEYYGVASPGIIISIFPAALP